MHASNNSTSSALKMDILYEIFLNYGPYALILSIITITYWYFTSPKGLPPGSAGLPIVGYLPFLNRRSYLTFNKLAKKFGNIFHLYLGSRLVIVLNDYEAVKEAFSNQADIFSGRPEDMNFNIEANDNSGITTTDGVFWQEHRRFLLKTLRDYGMGKLSLEPHILEEIGHFIEEIQSYKGKPKNLHDIFSHSFANNIYLLLAGRRFNYNDKVLVELLADTKIISSTSGSSVAFRIFFPWLSRIPGIDIITGKKSFKEFFDNMSAAMQNILDDVRKNFVDGDKSNYVHAFMTEKNSRNGKTDNQELFSEISLLHNARDIMGAGSATMTITSLWAMVFMAREPEIQKRVQTEIDEVIGKDRLPSWTDRALTPYTEATLLEIQRMASIVPLNLTHRNLKDTTLCGHRIPKSSYIISNLWNVHHDPKLWNDPHTFNPDRFLDSEGKVSKPEYMIPFSIGKRMCVGESLAKMELYLYITSILQRFTVLPEDRMKPTAESLAGFALIPKVTTFRLASR